MVTKLDAWVGVIMVFDPGYWDWGPKVLPRISSAPLRMSKLLLWFHGRKVSYAVKLELTGFHSERVMHLIYNI
jgi:hypothetical protein